MQYYYKTSFKLLIIVLFSTSIISCSGPRQETRKMLNKMEEFTEVALKAAEDGVLSKQEIEEINKISKELAEIEKKREKSIKESPEYAKKAEEAMKTEEGEKVIKEFMNAIFLLYECEGAEHLE